MAQTIETSAHLWSTKAGADKVYNLYIRQKPDGWVVDYTNGKRGGTLQSGTKTEKPVSYEVALKLFDTTVRAKTKDGYGSIDSGVAYTSSEFSDRATGLDVQLLTSIDSQRCNELVNNDEWCMQLKENGERRLLLVKDGVVTGANRTGLLVNIPEQWEKDFAVYFDATFDGEHVGDSYAVFDLLSVKNEDLRHLPFASRYLKLVKLLDSRYPTPSNFRLVEAHTTADTKTLLLQHVRDMLLEGVVLKRAMAPYQSGRSADALKFKMTASVTCIVVRQNTQRSVVLGLLDDKGDLQEHGNVTIPANHRIPEPGALVEVQFLYYTGKAFEQPVYSGERNDLKRSDARIDQITRVKPAGVPVMANA